MNPEKTMKTITLDKGTYVLLPKEDYQNLVARANGVELPAYPPADKNGNRPAMAFGLTSIARSMITRRLNAGWSQEELAKRAKVRPETISRLEAGKHQPQAGTVTRIDAVLTKAGF